MTTVTAPLRDLRRAAEEAEKDAATVELLRRDLVEAQKVKIGELERELAEVQEMATNWYYEALVYPHEQEMEAQLEALKAEVEALRAVAEKSIPFAHRGHMDLSGFGFVQRDELKAALVSAGYLREGEEAGK